MANLVETSVFEEGIYQLEEEDVVLGGPDGIDNVQPRQLANRTKYLKDQLEDKTGDATTTKKGIVELATNAEVLTGTDTARAVTPAGLAAKVAALIDSSPAALDTLNELAAALGDDPNFATTITNALALKAALASPAFTGNPTAPTPAAADNDTSVATTAFVKTAIADAIPSDASATVKGIVELATHAEVQTGADTVRAVTPAGLNACTATETRRGVVELATTAEVLTGTDTERAVTPAGLAAKVAALIDSSPAALDTLNELAAALGDDPNFATTITNALALKAALASPAFTGNPTAPTPESGNNTTRIASTAFVQSEIASASTPDATTTVKGKVELSTDAETIAGASSVVVVTPANLSSRTATETRTGIVEKATIAETQASTPDKYIDAERLGDVVIGMGQTWQDVTGSRVLGATYTNTTGRPIMVNISCATTSGIAFELITEGLTLYGSGDNVAGSRVSITALIRAGQTYNAVAGGKTLTSWKELR